MIRWSVVQFPDPCSLNVEVSLSKIRKPQNALDAVASVCEYTYERLPLLMSRWHLAAPSV